MPVSNRRVEEALSYLVQVQERADRGKAYSRQERIDMTNAFGSFFGLYKTYLSERHKFAYQADSRKRDQWLRDFWRREPHIAGVINSVVSIDKNRSWTLTGTKRQVVLYNNVLRMADDGEGWREFMSVAAESYYTTDMGTVVEVGRQGRFGPMRGLYNVNPTHVRLTGNRDFPLEYIPPTGKSQKWSWVDFFRVASLPNIAMNGLGFCALSRAVELVCLLMAVYEYDQERLLAKAPKGLLLLHNIGQQQWEDAMAARKENMSKLGQEYFSGVMVLAQEGMDQMDAKLIGLSQLPDGFDREVVTNQIMYGISMIFGYTPDEFWPVQYGALGRARETEIHHMRAVTKGGSDFTLGIQDRLQRELPDTVLFEFDKRDSETDILEAEVYQAWAKVAESLYGNNIPQFVERPEQRLLTREEVRSLLASKGIINADMTEVVEDTVANAQGTIRNRTRQRSLQEEYRERDAVVRSATVFPNDPILRLHYPSGRIEVIYERGDDVFRRRVWRGVEMEDPLVDVSKTWSLVDRERIVIEPPAEEIIELSSEVPEGENNRESGTVAGAESGITGGHDLYPVLEGIPSAGEYSSNGYQHQDGG